MSCLLSWISWVCGSKLFCPVQTDFSTVAELAFLLLHSLCPFLVIHSSPPALLASLSVGDNTQTKMPPNLIISPCYRGLAYSPGSRYPERPVWGSGCWWSQMPPVLEPAVIFVWPVICVQAVTASHSLPQWGFLSGCITQDVLPRPLLYQGWSWHHPVTPLCAYFMAKSFCGLNNIWDG